MATTFNLGKVTTTWRGAYSPAAQYAPLDVVSYGGSSWVVLQNITGIIPAAGTYYALMAQVGQQGPRGYSGNYPLVADDSATAVTLEMLANTEYKYSAGVSAVALTFGSADASYSTSYIIQFLSGASAPTVSVPAAVAWKDGAPTFAANTWYRLRFDALGDNFVGTYASVSA